MENSERQELIDGLDAYWQKRIKQSVTKAKYQTKSTIGFSANEALLALDRDNPNIAMAISRLRQIIEFCNTPSHD